MINKTQQQKRNTPGYLYLVVNEWGWRKIGISRKPPRRIYQLKRKHKDPSMHFDGLYKVSNMASCESFMHRLFSEKRVSGEWFDLDNREIQVFRFFAERMESGINVLG